MSPIDWVLILEETGRFALPEPLIETIALVPFLVEAGEHELVNRIVLGESRVTLCTRDGYALDADRAERVYQIQDEHLVMYPQPQLTPQPSMDGSRRLFSIEGESAVVAGDVQAVMNRAVLACSAQLLGLGHHVLDAAVTYSKERHQFGNPIGSFQAVQHHLVNALLKLKFAAPMVYRAAWSLSENHPDAQTHVSMAKIYASEAAYFATRQSLQVHGAIGYTHELDLHLWLKRIWALKAAWGSPDQHRDIAAAAILGEENA